MGALTGCDSGSKPDGKIHITFMHNIDKTVGEAITAFVNAFNKDETVNPGLKYKVEAPQTGGKYDDLVDKTISQLTTGNYCDILYAYPDSVQKFLDRGYTIDMTDYIYSEDPEIGLSETVRKDIVEGYFLEGQQYTEKGIFSMPFSKSSEVVFVNERLLGWNLNILKDQGISPEDFSYVNGDGVLTKTYLNNLTWEELFNVLAPALKKFNDLAAGTQYQLYTPDATGQSAVFAVDSDDNFFITLARQYGIPYTEVEGEQGNMHGYVKFDNSQMAKLLAKFAEFYRKGYLITGKIFGGNQDAYTSDLFLNNSCLFTLSSTAGAKNVKSKTIICDVLNVPHADPTADDEHSLLPGHGELKEYNKIISQGPSICILDHDNAERAEGAWRFYKYFLEEKSAIWSCGTTSGYLPIRSTTYESEDYEEISSTTGKTKGSVDYCLAITYAYSAGIRNKVFTSPVFKQSAAARTQAGSAMAQALLSSGTESAILDILKTCAAQARKG